MRRRRRFATLVAATLALGGCTVVGVTPAPEALPPPPGPEAVPDREEVRPDLGEREPDAVAPPFRPLRRYGEVRGLWVVRFTMTSRETVRAMVERAEAAGINTLIVQVRGRADAFYASTVEPRAEPVRAPGTFDPLAYVIEEAHARGMAVHAWVNTHLVWGPAALPVSADHVVNAHPDWLAVPRPIARDLAPLQPTDPRYVAALIDYAQQRPATVEGVYTSPSHPEVQRRVHQVWLDIATRYDLDGMHFDYIRYPSADFDYSVDALERFRVWALPRIPEDRYHHLAEASRRDVFAFTDALPELWDRFRSEQVTGLVRRIYRDVKRVRPGLVVSAAVVPDPEEALEERFQDWTGWLREGILDVAVPMAYTPDRSRFGELIREARRVAGAPYRVWAGIGAYMNTAGSTVEMIDVARAEDAGGVVLFSYDWAVGEGVGDTRDPFLQRIGRARFGND
jgi:uncharacterized lipoprotein YddW (UPF0748 family)